MIARRKPISRKRAGPPRKGRLLDPQYLDWIRAQQCVICALNGPPPSWADVEAAHIGRRGLGQKCSDHETIPLCAYYHRISNRSAHATGANFWDIHSLDRQILIAGYRQRYLEEFPERAK